MGEMSNQSTEVGFEIDENELNENETYSDINNDVSSQKITGSFQCKKCSSSFVSSKALKNHIFQHHKTIKCKFCGKKFGSVTGEYKHYHNRHAEEWEAYQSAKKMEIKTRRLAKKRLYAKMKKEREANEKASTSTMEQHVNIGETSNQSTEVDVETVDNELNEQNHADEEKISPLDSLKHNETNSDVVRKFSPRKTTGSFQCSDCSSSFKSSESLLNHKIQHNDIKSIGCNFCNKTFATHKGMSHHTRLIHTKKLQKNKAEQSEILKNIKQQSMKITSTSENSLMKKETIETSRKQIKENETELLGLSKTAETSMERSESSVKFNDSSETEVLEMNSNSDEETVDDCSDDPDFEVDNTDSDDSDTKDNIVDDNEEHDINNELTTEKQKEFFCNLCIIKFDNLLDLYNHSIVHNEIVYNSKVWKTSTGPHKCDECTFGFQSINALMAHKIRHRTIKSLKCKVCNKFFCTSNGLGVHYKNYHKKLWKPRKYSRKNTTLKFETDTFDSGNDRKSNDNSKKSPKKRKNNKTTFSITVPYCDFIRCNLCNIPFASPILIYTHAMETHKSYPLKPSQIKYKPGGTYQCDECDHATWTIHTLRTHKLRHRRVKPFGCQQCPKGFSGMQELKYHYSLQHPEEWKIIIKKIVNKRDKTPRRYNKKYSDERKLKNLKQDLELDDAEYIELPEKEKLVVINDTVLACPLCNIIFDNIGLMYSHCQKIHPDRKQQPFVAKKLTSGIYKCDECLYCFNDVNNFRNHKLRHRNIKSFGCKYCGRLFSSRNGVINHYWTDHEAEKNEEGVPKPQWFINFENRRKNLQLEIPSEQIENVHKYNCKKCKLDFESVDQLNKHRKKIHKSSNINKKKGSYVCNECAEVFIKLNDLKHHIRRHLLAFCKICTTEFQNQNELESHCRLEHPEIIEEKAEFKEETTEFPLIDLPPEKIVVTRLTLVKPVHLNIQCRKCYQRFATRAEYCIHSMTAHRKSFTCNECNTICLTKSSLRSHIKAHLLLHFECQKCKRSFKSLKRLESHYCDDNPYICIICNASFSSKHLLTTHVNTHPKNHICTVCGDGFLDANRLKFHNIKKHLPHKHLCPLCGATFALSGSLNIHLKQHENMRHKCKECGRRFITLKLLRNHFNIEHREVCFFCNICGLALARKDDLAVHMKTHNKLKPYTCEYCGKGFSCMGGYKYHVNFTHKARKM